MNPLNSNWFSFVTFFLLFSCGDNNFKDRYDLGPARILGVYFDLPEISPGSTATVNAIVSFEDQTTETLESRLRYCPDPGLAFGVDPTCEQQPGTTLLYDWTPLSFSDPAVKTQILNSMGAITAPADFLNQSGDAEKLQGKIILVEYSIRVSGTLTSSAFSRLRVSDPTLKPQKNLNPILNDVLINQVALSARPATLTGELGVSFDSSSLQTGEELLTSFYVSKGKVKYPRIIGSQTTTWDITAQENLESATLTVVAVGRDENGGLAVQIKTGL